MGLSDDDDRGEGPSTSQAAGFGPDDDPQLDLALNNDEPLDMHGIDSRIWLVKVPKFLLERWQNVREEGKELGRLRVYKKPLPNGDERIAVLLPPARPGEAEIPTEYAMNIQNKQTKNTLIFAEKDDVTHGEAGWEPGRGRIKPHEVGDAAKRPAKRRMPTVTGVVNHECNLTPRVDSASYRKIMRQRQAKAAEPKRTIQRLDDDRTEQSRLGLAGMTGRKFDFVMKTTNKPKADTTNRFLARVPRNEILDMLFSAFEQYDYWSLKNLRSHTQQPETYLKEVLADIAQLNRRGPYAGMWSLQEGFRRQIKAESSGTAAKTEHPDGEDVKPNIEGLDDDDDDEDVDMDAVLMNSTLATGHANASTKKSILQLPLTKSLPELLTADPATPDVAAVLSLSQYDSSQPSSSRPSNLRRSRQVNNAHFSYVTPLPVSFPYSVRPGQVRSKKLRKVSGEAVGDGSAVKAGARTAAAEEAKAETETSSSPKPVLDVEDFLASLEPDTDNAVESNREDVSAAYTSDDRRAALGTAKLVGLSRRTLDEILPDLDVGDAWQYLQQGGNSTTQDSTRETLTSFLAGHVVRGKLPTSQSEGFAPWSLCYGGHQFGSWASQLGDGRAISIMTTPARWPTYHKGTYYPPVAELQLKGAGRTPYSRFADGLAVLRSSVREYLGSEAMAALGIPTSRALSLVHLPDVQVLRERVETAAIVCRVAPSWVRIGSFELPWSRDQWDTLRDLVNYTAREVYGFGKQEVKLEDEPTDLSLTAEVLREASRRTARLVAGWQATGFMHGVLNTDNISIAGLTIDYGPYAWMDIYSPNHICNHSDGEGRYSYRNQPPICVEAIQRLGSALAELIGYELELAGSGRMVASAQRGWAIETSKLEGWRSQGLKVVEEVATEFTGLYVQEYKTLMAKRLGLSEAAPSDFSELFDPLLRLMSEHELDFSRTFRLLTQFTSTKSEHMDRFFSMLCPQDQVPKHLHSSCREDWTAWLEKWQARLEQTEAGSEFSADTRRQRMKTANPRFILRQWVLEEAISRLEKDNDIAFLQLVLDMAVNPFEDYGEDLVDLSTCSMPTKEVLEQRRLCEIGDRQMLGFQCSCSS